MSKMDDRKGRKYARRISFILGVMSKFYQGPNEAFVNGYVWDVAVPFYLYNAPINTDNKLIRAAAGLAPCVMAEFAQKLGYYHGTFDWNDFIAYAAGTALAVGVDVFVDKISERKVGKNFEKKPLESIV
jgi:hypothetical protein